MDDFEKTVAYAKSLGWRVVRTPVRDSTQNANSPSAHQIYFILYKPGETRQGVMGKDEEGLWKYAYEKGKLPKPPDEDA